MRYQIIADEARDTANVTVFTADGRALVATQDHPNYYNIVRAIHEGLTEDEVADLFDASERVAREFDRVTDRVSVADGQVFLDGDPVDTSLTRQIVRFAREQRPFAPLARFLENLVTNPTEHSREQLYDWLSDRDWTITDDGCFLAYKGVSDNYESIHSGHGIVNGQEVHGHLDNSPGNVVEIPRSEVEHDPSRGCAPGLHAATWEFASNWGSRALLVKVNPRDVVSVPTDSNAQKLRVSRYEVVEDATEEFGDVLYGNFGREDEHDHDLDIPDWVNEPEGVEDTFDPGSAVYRAEDSHERDEGPGVVFVRFVPSDSNPGRDYLVEKWSTGDWSCECGDYLYRNRECKHISRAKVRDIRGV